MNAWISNLLNNGFRFVCRASDGRPDSLAMQSSIIVRMPPPIAEPPTSPQRTPSAPPRAKSPWARPTPPPGASVRRGRRRPFAAIALAVCAFVTVARGTADELTYQHEGKEVTLSGRCAARTETQIIWISRDQQQTAVDYAQIERVKECLASASPWSGSELQAALSQDYPACQLLSTEHYVIVHEGSREGARQLGRTAEAVFEQYFEFWRDRGWPLDEPNYPLILVALENPQRRARHDPSAQLLWESGLESLYSLESNRVLLRQPSGGERTVGLDPLRSPQVRLQTNLAHEAVHQLMANSGAQPRHGDYPLWLSEGLACYFEAVDPLRRSGYRKPGGENPIRAAGLASWRRSTRDTPPAVLGGGQMVSRPRHVAGRLLRRLGPDALLVEDPPR